MRQKGITPILILVFVLIVAGIGFIIWENKSSSFLQVDLPILKSSASPTPTQNNLKTYTNATYKYSIQYPSDLTPQSTSDDFVSFADSTGTRAFDIALRARPENKMQLSFDDYVKIAASEEIQNYDKLDSITEIRTTSGITGYETTWKITPLGQGESSTNQASPPITYFDPNLDNKSTIQITLDDSRYLDIYNQVLTTFELNK